MILLSNRFWYKIKRKKARQKLQYNRRSYLNTHRDAWVEVNLDSIEKNILELKKYLHPEAKLFAVVKADAYGHGAVMIAPVLLASGVDFLGVSSIDELLIGRQQTISLFLFFLTNILKLANKPMKN